MLPCNSCDKNALIRALLENAPDFVSLKDTECKYIDVSVSKAKEHGFNSPGELIGLTDWALYTGVSAEMICANELTVLQTGISISEKEHMVTYIDGRTAWLSTTISAARDMAGDIMGTMSISRDVTEQKETSLSLNALLSYIPDTILICTDTGDILQVLPVTHSVPWADEKSVIGASLNELGNVEVGRQLTAEFKKVRTTSEKELVLLNIGDFTFEASIAPYNGSRIIVLIRDITQRKQFEILRQWREAMDKVSSVNERILSRQYKVLA